MHVRVTKYKMKPEAIEEATAMLEKMKGQIMALPGMKQFINSINADGSGCVIAVNESREQATANEPASKGIWALYSDHLAVEPETQGFDVVVNWSN